MTSLATGKWHARAVAGPDWRAEKRRAIDEVFARSVPGESTLHESPSGRYELQVTGYDRTGGWNYSEGVVRQKGGGETIAVIRRNYGAFPFTWCENHPSGHDLFIAGEDYQGQTIVELDTGERVDHLSDSAQSGGGFCWAQHLVAPDKTVLIVDGCYWAAPYELVAFDFSVPMHLPYLELHRWAGDLATVDGFDEHGVLTWTFDREVRISDGKFYDELTEEEEAELLDADGRHYLPGVFGSNTYRARWQTGTPFESTDIDLVTTTH
jgi:hypothetical protein